MSGPKGKEIAPKKGKAPVPKQSKPPPKQKSIQKKPELIIPDQESKSIESALEEMAENEAMTMPPISEMLKATLVHSWADQTEEAEQIRLAAEQVVSFDKKSGPAQGGVIEGVDEVIMSGALNPEPASAATLIDGTPDISGGVPDEDEWARLTKSNHESSSTSSPLITTKQAERKKKDVEDNTGRFPEESIASARELEDVRETVSDLELRMRGTEEQLTLVMKERQILPDKLENLTRNITKQLSDMLDKLHVRTEQNLAPAAVEAAASNLVAIREETSSQLKSASSNLLSVPSKSSPLTNVTGTLRPKRKRFAPLK